MDGAIEVVFWGRDVVIELALDVGPQAVHDSEGGIALRYGVHDDSYRAHVEELFEGEMLTRHLSVDAVHVLRSSVHLGAHTRLGELRSQGRTQLFDVTLAVGAPLVQLRRDAPVVVGLQVAKRQILQLPLELPDSEAVGERGEDCTGLDCAPFPLLR